MMPTLYILMPVHNRIEVTTRFVDCLAAQTFTDYHLVVIDDGSTDGTAEMVQSKIENLTVLKGKGDWWWAGSLQKGIMWLAQRDIDDRDIVLFANDDITFESTFLQVAVDILDSVDASLLLPQLSDMDSLSSPKESGVSADLQNVTFSTATSADKINCLSTRGLFMRMKDLRRIGRFHPFLLPHYWSDYEFTIRARRKGLMLLTSAKLTICLDHEQTGYHNLEGFGFVDFLKLCFSKKYVLNPIYHTNFVLLACPVQYIPRNLFRIWNMFCRLALRKLKTSLYLIFQRMMAAYNIRRLRADLKIIIGADSTRQKGWLSTNVFLLDLTSSLSFSSLLKPGSVDCFLAEHVWEHLSVVNAKTAAGVCFEFLKPGAYLRVAVPDGYHPDPAYIDHVRPGGTGPGAGDHKVLYNHLSFADVFTSAGYEVHAYEYFDIEGNFHFREWSPEGGMVRRSVRFDPRNIDGEPNYTSIILDAVKPARSNR